MTRSIGFLLLWLGGVRPVIGRAATSSRINNREPSRNSHQQATLIQKSIRPDSIVARFYSTASSR
jgi:hypothetical protein